MKPEYILDGRRVTTLEAFHEEIGRVLLAGRPPSDDPDTLDALLGGEYGRLPESFRLVWRDAGVAREALGYDGTVNHFLKRLRDCPPTVLIKTAWALRAVLRGQGPTLYDRLVETIRRYPNVELILVETDGGGENSEIAG
jgi:hypothetical protein